MRYKVNIVKTSTIQFWWEEIRGENALYNGGRDGEVEPAMIGRELDTRIRMLRREKLKIAKDAYGLVELHSS